MKKTFSLDYSERSDILNVRKKGCKSAGAAELGDFTLDFDYRGALVGIEIMNASEFFSHSGIAKEQLSEIKTAAFSVQQKKQGIVLVWLKIILPKNDERIFSIPAPILDERKAVVA